MNNFKWYRFSELTLSQLYEILKLRSDVFVVEQSCVYLDPDGKDQEALHLLGQENNTLVAYLRLFLPIDAKEPVVFGRVLTAKSARAKGHGKKLMAEMLEYCEQHFPGVTIACHAQYYLKNFYESFGFQICGDTFMEDDILHVLMQK